jgi:hypothetical protein
MTWQHCWSVHWYPKVQSASVLGSAQPLSYCWEVWGAVLSLGHLALIYSRHLKPFMITLLGTEMVVLQWGWHIFPRESDRQPETAVAPTCLSQRDNTGQSFLAGIYQDKDWIVLHISTCSLCIYQSDSQTFSCDLGMRKIMAVSGIPSETVNDKCLCQHSA